MTTDDLAAIKARADAATPGPWAIDFGSVVASDGEDFVTPCYPDERGQLDADFIAHAREDVPALLARVRELEADRDDWQQAARVYAKSRDASDHRADKARARVTELEAGERTLLAVVEAVNDRATIAETVVSRLLAAERERDESLALVDRQRGLLDAYMAVVCACGHGRTSHTPADFGDCTECPHGTCGKYPGILWDLWHRETLAERDEARAEVERLREVIAGFDEDHAAAFRRGQMRAAAEVARLRAQVAAVEALCDDPRWKRRGTYAAGQRFVIARVRAALAGHTGEAP
jgi:hypothetical protein